MKQSKNIIKTVGLAALVGFTATSCDLDLLPLNEVVLENYWKNEDDVNSSLYSCYVGMQENGWIEKAITWGEVRSDNVTTGKDVPTNLQNLIKGNLKQTNAACVWDPFYDVINRCNTVLHYAPGVHAKDPNFNASELTSVQAQCHIIRDLNYFYLARTFRNVPYVTVPTIDDTQELRVKASKQEAIIDSLIDDVEAWKDNVPRKYSSSRRDNTGYLTRVAAYALLADLYLWRASDANVDQAKQDEDYRRCIAACDYIINEKIKEYKLDEQGDLNTAMDQRVDAAFGYPLLAEKSSSGADKNAAAAYNAIFGQGNSFESLFELTFTKGSSEVHNKDLHYMYGGTNDSGTDVQYCSAATQLMTKAIESSAKNYSDQSLFSVTTDYRSLTGFTYSDEGSYQINKYSAENLYSGSGDDAGNMGTAKTNSWGVPKSKRKYRAYEDAQEGWIIYRLTDVMLMRAEAELELAGHLSQDATPDPEVTAMTTYRDGQSLSTAAELYDDAFNIISAVYLRSNPELANATTTYSPKRSNYTDYSSMVKLLDNERHREFLFEGKRYYDLVRRSRREGNTSFLAQAVSSKFGEASKVVLIKMALIDFMYMPYAEKQLDVNPELYYDEEQGLHQNPAYAEDEDITQN